jgi:hypothetical protein
MKWMNEILNIYIYQTSHRIVINQLQKVLTYYHLLTNGWNAMLAFCSPSWNVCGSLMWRLIAKKLHIVACGLHHIYNILYNIRCPL